MSEQILTSQTSKLSSQTEPPSILPISHDILKHENITSLDHNSTKELSKLHASTSGENDDDDRFWRKENKTQRGMQSRHLTMIAIGGTGTGIFLSAGIAVATGGPGSALLSYFVLGIFVYTVVITLGEMSSMYPVSGAFATFGTRFVSPALGFTLGWNYWLQWTLSISSELTAAAVILQFWTPALHPWEWAIIIIVPIFALQLIHVRVYGESEYWFVMIKVIMIILFIIVGLIYDTLGGSRFKGPLNLNATGN